MRILYIPSGFKRIYEYFDNSIIKELAILKHEVKSFNALLGLDHLQSIVRSFRPNLVLTMVGIKMPTKIITWLREQGIPTAIWFTEDPYYIDRTLKLLPYYDIVFTIDTAALKVYQDNGHKQCYYLPLGANPLVYHTDNSTTEKKYDLCLVGYPYPDRVKLIKLLLQKSAYTVLVVGAKWDQYLKSHKQNRNLFINNNWVAPNKVVQYYHQSKIVLNTHRPFDLKENQNSLLIINESVNNRTFEIACCGAFQLIDHKTNVSTYFDKGKEIVSFQNDDDFLEKVNYCISHTKERMKIAKNANEKALKEHTFSQRIKQMLAFI